MSEIIKYSFGDRELDDLMAQYDDEEEPTPMTPEDGRRMLDRLAAEVEIGPPGPAHKAPLFRWALLGMICSAVAAVGIVAWAAVALGQRLEPNPSGVSESHTTTHLSIHIADPTIDTCLMALATGVCLIQYRAADRALVFPQGFTVSIGAPKP